jgi:hypothetical protein
MAELTIDQELDLLDDAFRRLKVEYDIYFSGAGGSAKRPPVDNEARMQSQVRRFMENSRLTLVQRYRLTNMAQRYAVFSDLWRRKARIKDGGYVRPQDRLIGVGGFGHLDERRPSHAFDAENPESFVVFTNDVLEVVPLYESVIRARETAGQPLGAFDSFAAFVQLKTESIRNQFKCQSVEYTVVVTDGQVRLKARPRKDI